MTPKNKPTTKRSNSNNSLLESLLKYTFAALLIFIPLYPKFPLFNVPGTYVAVRAEDFIIALLAVLLLLLLRPYFKFFTKSPTAKAILVFWLVALFATLSGVFLTKTTPLSLGLLHWARRVEYTIPFFAGLLLARNKDNLLFFVKLIPLIALAVFVYGLAQIYFNAPVISTQSAEYSTGIALTLQPGVNLSSTFAGHYDLATYLTMTLSLSAGLLLLLRRHLPRLLGVTFLLILFWLQLRTGSRIAFGATVLSLSLVFLLGKKPLWIIPVFLVAFVGLVNTPSISGRFGNLFDVFKFSLFQDQVKGLMDSRTQLLIPPLYAADASPSSTPKPTPIENKRAIQEDRSTSIRLDVEWPRALRALKKNPFFGTGYASISLATDNDYLRALGETGLLGFIALITIIINIITDLLSNLKKKLSSLERFYSLGALGLVFGFLIIATFIDVFEASKVATLFWMYTGLASGIALKHS